MKRFALCFLALLIVAGEVFAFDEPPRNCEVASGQEGKRRHPSWFQATGKFFSWCGKKSGAMLNPYQAYKDWSKNREIAKHSIKPRPNVWFFFTKKAHVTRLSDDSGTPVNGGGIWGD